MRSGFIIIDKPAGITSHDVVSRVRRILETRRVGHTGTLDPFATGVLPIAVQDGTKTIPFLDEGLKRYEAVMQLGVTTDTLDMTGQVQREGDFSSVTREQLQSVLVNYTGSISQLPPMYSAIKQGGQPLYKLARKGEVVERPVRPVEIFSIDVLSFLPPFVSFRVACSRGTYVRTLADDIGTSLGCGAALKELRRTASGPFEIRAALSLTMLENAVREGRYSEFCVTPYAALEHLVDIQLTESGMTKVAHGRSPLWDETLCMQPRVSGEQIRVRLSHNGELVAVAELVGNSEVAQRIVLKRVFV